jgi:hypothetical protein
MHNYFKKIIENKGKCFVIWDKTDGMECVKCPIQKECHSISGEGIDKFYETKLELVKNIVSSELKKALNE